MSPSEADRALILRRRAAFVASALATLGGCGGAKPGPSSEPQSPVIAVPEPTGDAGATEEQPPDPERQTAATGGMPSLEIPDGITPRARENFERLVGQARRSNDLLDRLEGTLRTGCDIADSACDARLKVVAEGFVELDELVRFLYPVCPGSSEGAKLYAQRSRQHLDWIAERRRRIEDRVGQLLTTDIAQQRWEEHRRVALAAHPQVCLSIACQDW